jgi:hypothetical protein
MRMRAAAVANTIRRAYLPEPGDQASMRHDCTATRAG